MAPALPLLPQRHDDSGYQSSLAQTKCQTLNPSEIGRPMYSMSRMSHKKLDSAIIQSLQIDPVDSSVSVSGYSKISITRKNHIRHYFLKTSSEKDMENTFEGTLPVD